MARTNKAKTRQAEILREYGPYPGIDHVHGVTIVALDPVGGGLVRELPVAADAGTAFDGRYLWQLAGDRIQKVDPRSGQVIATIPAPAHGRDSGLTWAEGTLWVGEYRARKIHQIDAGTGAILRTVESVRHRRLLGERRALARHHGGRAELSASRRSRDRRGPRAPRDARGRRRERPRGRRGRRLLLRWWHQRQGAR